MTMNTGAACDPAGKTVLVLVGEFAGQEGICLGRVPGAEDLWAVSPEFSVRIVNLKYDQDFGIVINSGQRLGQN